MNTRIRSTLGAFGAAVAFASIAATPSDSAAQGLTFTATPSARWIQWDDALGFDDSRLLGGAIGIGFGRYVGLEAFHHEDEVEFFSDAVDPYRTDLALSGARVTLAFGAGTLVPVIGGGASILRLEPAGGETTKKLSFDYGAGLRMVFAERIQGEVTVEQTRYRLPFEGAEGSDDDFRRNLTLRAGLGIQLGRRSFDRADDLDSSFAERYQAPFSGFALAIEPLIGRLDFDEATGLERQDMVGVRAGIDFGSFFGLRAFHWWGTESDFTTTNGMRAFGGEAQFNLSAGPGLTPYLSGGAARLTWSERGNGVSPVPADQTSAVVGGGVDFNFGPRVRLTVAARDYILTGADLAESPDLESVADPDDLIHNWQFSAGLKFVLGGGGGFRSAAPAPVDTPMAPAMPEDPTAELEPMDEPATPADAEQPAPAAAGTVTPTVRGTADSTRMMMIPVPEQGEIYIRFGEPAAGVVRLQGDPGAGAAAGATPAAGIDPAALREIIREELDRLNAGDTPEPAEEDPRIRALEARIDSLARLLREQRASGGQVEAAAPARPAVQASPDDAAPPVDRSIRETRFHTGFTTTGPTQFLVGGGADIGPLSGSWQSIHLVPSVAVGFGEGDTSFLAQLGLEYRTGTFRLGGLGLQPMVGVGAGLFKAADFEAIVPTFLGATLDLAGDEPHNLDGLYIGLQGVDFMTGGRLLVGLRRIR